MKLLILDDDKIDRQLLIRYLKDLNPTTLELINGADCLKTLSYDQDFDCLIIDYQLPDIDGLTLVQKIRLNKIFIPILVISGYGDEMLVVHLLKKGADHYLPKNLLTADLLKTTVTSLIEINENKNKILRNNLAMLKDIEIKLDAMKARDLAG